MSIFSIDRQIGQLLEPLKGEIEKYTYSAGPDWVTFDFDPDHLVDGKGLHLRAASGDLFRFSFWFRVLRWHAVYFCWYLCKGRVEGL